MNIYIDTATQKELDVFQVRNMFFERTGKHAKDSELWDDDYLSPAGFNVIEYIEDPKPAPERWQSVQREPLDKSVNGVWRQTWSVHEPSLETAALMLRADVDKERDARLLSQDAVVTMDDGRVFQTKPSAYAALQGALISALAGALPVSTVWRDINNVDHPADAALLTQIAAKEAERQDAIWKWSWAKKTEISKAKSLNDLRNIIW